MKSIRHTVLGTAAVALSMPLGLAHPLALSSAPQSEAPASIAEEACTCTCAVCAAKHGPKAQAAGETTAETTVAPTVETAAESEAQSEVESVAVPAPNLPDAPTDIAAEVARILATDLEALDELVETDGLTGVVWRGAAEVRDVEEVPSAERGYMGVSLGADQSDGRATISGVNSSSPAESAGIQVGDIVVAVDSIPVDTVDAMLAEFKGLKAGQTVTLEIERGDEELELDLVLGTESVLENGVPTATIEEEIEVTLPSDNPVLLQVVGDEDGNEFVLEDVTEGAEQGDRFLFKKDEPGKVERTVEVEGRWSTKPGRGMGASDALPEGYVEITTTRERRPADNDAMRRRMNELEREVAELSRIVAELRAELDRRNPR